MTDLIAFLRARLDEDEATARAALTDEPWSEEWGCIYADGELLHCEASSSDARTEPIGRHVVRWQPARVLAEVEAKRTILPAHSPGLDDPSVCNICGCLDCYRVNYPCPTLLALAQPYAEHPEYPLRGRQAG